MSTKFNLKIGGIKNMESIHKIVDSVNGLLWGKNILVFMLIGTAIYFSVKTKFMQFRLFHKIIKVLFKNEKGKHGISSLETFFLGTACRVGAGNIAGVGSATAFIESSLAVIYRKKEKDGSFTGGTPFIIEKRLGMRWLGIVYALASVVCYFGVTQVMSNSITSSITSVYTWGANNKFLNLQNISSIAVAVLVAYVIFFSKSKKDSIVESLNKIVPFMAIVYVVAVIYILVTNLTHIPAMIGNIISQAFGTSEVLGGTFGAVVMNGVRRGLFSNEAGSGNSNYAAAAVHSMVQAFGVFIDTLVICSATAFIVLLAPKSTISGLSGMGLFQAAMTYHLDGLGAPFVVVLMFFFCVSTILAVAFYGRSAVSFIHESKNLNTIYQVILILMIYIGGIKQDMFIWSLADFGLGIMTVINILVIIPIAKPALDSLKSYEKELK